MDRGSGQDLGQRGHVDFSVLHLRRVAGAAAKMAPNRRGHHRPRKQALYTLIERGDAIAEFLDATALSSGQSCKSIRPSPGSERGPRPWPRSSPPMPRRSCARGPGCAAAAACRAPRAAFEARICGSVLAAGHVLLARLAALERPHMSLRHILDVRERPEAIGPDDPGSRPAR